jgi:hypothetical protein
MSTQQFHGITSLGLVLLATIIGAVAIFLASWLLGLLYLLLCAGISTAVLYAFCAKCPCRTHCGHIFPGKLAGIFGHRRPGPYSTLELGVVLVGLLALFGLPQFWLWHIPGLLVAFWLLIAIGLTQIRTVLCRRCNNRFCPLRVSSTH